MPVTAEEASPHDDESTTFAIIPEPAPLAHLDPTPVITPKAEVSTIPKAVMIPVKGSRVTPSHLKPSSTQAVGPGGFVLE